MQKIEKMGSEKFGKSGVFFKDDVEGFKAVFAPSFYKAIGNKVKALKQGGNLKEEVVEKVNEAIAAKDIKSLKAIVDIGLLFV